MTLVAALNALRHDAGVWDEISHTLGTAAQEANALTLTEADLSWASQPTGLLESYAQIQQKVAALLREGSVVCGGLSVTLDTVMHDYQLNDENAARKFKGVWDVHE
jgi:hypothetical protein